jgi:hypothetical protein
LAAVIDIGYSVNYSYLLAEACAQNSVPVFKFSESFHPSNSWSYNVHPAYHETADSIAKVMRYYKWGMASILSSPDDFGESVSWHIEKEISLIAKIWLMSSDEL